MCPASRTTEQHPGWRPSASLERIRARARLFGRIRRFLDAAGLMEVETPACSRAANSDPAIESLATRYSGPGCPQGETRYFHTSPEFPMKRLLAAGSGPIYQLCKVYRDGERGRLHSPEFTLLEWYRPGFDQHKLIDEVARLVRTVSGLDLPIDKASYRGLFKSLLGIDPILASVRQLRDCARSQGIAGLDGLGAGERDGWLDLLMSHCIGPRLGRGCLTFVYDYPPSQAALARIRNDAPPVAERFELYIEGMELANGFHELADPAEQRRRFEADLQRREQAGKPLAPMDKHLLAALESGLPDCSGVALGIDRLLLWTTGATCIDEVLSFAFEQA